MLQLLGRKGEEEDIALEEAVGCGTTMAPILLRHPKQLFMKGKRQVVHHVLELICKPFSHVI